MNDRQHRQDMLQRIEAGVRERVAEVEAQIIAEFGAVSPKHAALLDNLSAVEAMRLEAAEDVKVRGMQETYHNGRQMLKRKNPSVDVMLKSSNAAARIIAAMGLQKRSARAVPAAPVPGGDEDDLDDY